MHDALLYDGGSLFHGPDFQGEAMMFFQAVGHTTAAVPLVVAEDVLRCIYTELNFNAYFEKSERAAFSCIESLSHLFTLDCDAFRNPRSKQVRYYAVSIDTVISERTVVANVILKAFAKNTTDYFVILFHHNKKCMLSFAKRANGYATFFSDWFGHTDVLDMALRLDIANLSFQSSGEFFLDFVYMVARSYYTHPISRDYVHSEWFSYNEDDFNRPSWNDYANELMFEPLHKYGDDYIEVNYSEDYRTDNIDNTDFDFDLLELELDAMLSTDSLDLEDDDYDPHDEDSFDDEFEGTYVEEIPPDILNDPIKLLTWLRKNTRT